MLKFRIIRGDSCVFVRVDQEPHMEFTGHPDLDLYVRRSLPRGQSGFLYLDTSQFDEATCATSNGPGYLLNGPCELYNIDGGRVTVCHESLIEFFGEVPKELWFKINKEETT